LPGSARRRSSRCSTVAIGKAEALLGKGTFDDCCEVEVKDLGATVEYVAPGGVGVIPALPCGTFSDGDTPAGAFYASPRSRAATRRTTSASIRIENPGPGAAGGSRPAADDDVEIGSIEQGWETTPPCLLIRARRRRARFGDRADGMHRGTCPVGVDVMSDLPATHAAPPATYDREKLQLIRDMFAKGGRNDTRVRRDESNSPGSTSSTRSRGQIWLVKYGNNPAQIFCGRDGISRRIAHRSGSSTGMGIRDSRKDGGTISSAGAKSIGRT